MLHPCKGVLGVLQGYCTLGTSSFTLFFILAPSAFPPIPLNCCISSFIAQLKSNWSRSTSISLKLGIVCHRAKVELEQVSFQLQ